MLRRSTASRANKEPSRLPRRPIRLDPHARCRKRPGRRDRLRADPAAARRDLLGPGPDEPGRRWPVTHDRLSRSAMALDEGVPSAQVAREYGVEVKTLTRIRQAGTDRLVV